MKKRISRFLAGMLSVALVLSSGSYSVFAVAEDTAGNLEAVESEAVSGSDIEPEDTDSTQLPKAQEEEAVGAELPETDGEEQAELPAVSVSEIEEEGGDKNEISADAAEPAEAEPVKGVVEVWITAGAPAQSDQEFQVLLTKQASDVRFEQKVTLPTTANEQTEAPRVSARFPQLESGIWELSVTGGGYMAYTQEIEVKDGLGCRAQLYTGKVKIGTDETVHPGLLVRGDVNGDGILDQADANAIIDMIEATSGVENSGDC